MLYYTYNGVPVNEVPTEDLRACLNDGIEILYKESPRECVENVYKHIEIELYIRANNVVAA